MSDARLDAFLSVALPLAPAMYRTAHRLTSRAEDAAAVTEAALRLAAQALPGTAPSDVRGSLFGWLWQALGDQRRARGNADTLPDGESVDALLSAALAGDEGDLERLLLSRLDSSPEVDLGLRHLPDAERIVVLLVDVEDARYEDVARALSCGLDEVRGRLLHGRARLFAYLSDYARRTSGVHRVKQPAPLPQPHDLLRLQDSLDGRLSDEARALVSEHVLECESCRRALHALRWTKVRMAGAAAAVIVPATLEDDVRRMLEPPVVPPPPASPAPAGGRSRWFQWWMR